MSASESGLRGALSLWVLAGALAAALAAFLWTRERFGPDRLAAPGRVLTFVCTACGRSEVVALTEEEAADPARWPVSRRCPACGGTMRRAERCTSCGALVPTPEDGRLLDAKCPECGGPLFGPLGGAPVEAPIRPPARPHNGDRDDAE